MKAHDRTRIYVAPKRGRLPWHYQERPVLSTKQKLQLLSLLLFLCAGMAGLFWAVLR